MSEIERAIDDFKNYVEMGYGQYFRPSSESTELALTALEEKLEREKNPLTCDGCTYLPEKYNADGHENKKCWNCSRGTILPDRFKPKGEKA